MGALRRHHLITLVFFAIEYAFSLLTGTDSLFLLVPPVIIAGVAFDHGTGIFSALLGAALALAQQRATLDKPGSF